MMQVIPYFGRKYAVSDQIIKMIYEQFTLNRSKNMILEPRVTLNFDETKSLVTRTGYKKKLTIILFRTKGIQDSSSF